MAAEGFPGVPFRDDFGSEYPLPAFKDPRAVAMQLENLGHGAATTPWQRELIRFQIDRRESPANSQVDSLQPMKSLEDRGSELFLFGHLLVRHSDYFPEADPTRNVFNRTPMRKILEPYDLVDTVVDDLDGLVVKLTSETLDVTRLSDIARILRRAGYRASLDYITPLGPILKGQSGAEPADEKDFPLSFRPIEKQGRRVTVAIIDTGVTVRTDGWLEGIANKDNVDPLNVFPWGNPDRYLDFMAGHGTFAPASFNRLRPGSRLPPIDLSIAMASGPIWTWPRQWCKPQKMGATWTTAPQRAGSTRRLSPSSICRSAPKRWTTNRRQRWRRHWK